MEFKKSCTGNHDYESHERTNRYLHACVTECGIRNEPRSDGRIAVQYVISYVNSYGNHSAIDCYLSGFPRA